MRAETSASTPFSLNNSSNDSTFLSSYENKLRDTSHIIAEECLKSLKAGRDCAAQSQLHLKAVLNKTTNRLDKLKIKHYLICKKNAIDFADTLARRIERKPDYCHTLYNKYQNFLDSHTRLQCIGFYTYLEKPGLVSEFSMSCIPRHKKWARDIHAEGLNILSLGNNRKEIKRH